MPLSKQQLQERKQHLTVILVCVALFATPTLILSSALKQLKEGTQAYYGIMRPEAGRAVSESAVPEPRPENIAVLAVEALNGELTKLVLEVPAERNLLPTKTEATIHAVLLDRNPALQAALNTTKQLGGRWEPTAGPWGLFLTRKDKIPTNPQQLPFGIFHPIDGAEKTRITTELKLNRTHHEQDREETTILGVLQSAVESQRMTSEEARILLAQAEILQIEYQAEKNLFLSPQTNQEWDAVMSEINPP